MGIGVPNVVLLFGSVVCPVWLVAGARGLQWGLWLVMGE